MARWRDEHGKQNNHTLGAFDSYDAACKAARAWIDGAKGGVTEEVTVEEACKRYLADRRKEKGEGCAKGSANRNLATLKGALNLIYCMGLVGSTAQWDRVEAYKKVGHRRQRFLPEVAKLLKEAAGSATTPNRPPD